MTDKKSWPIARRLALLTLLLGLIPRPAHAVPSVDSLGSPNGYADVQPVLVGYSGGNTTYKFIVRNTQPSGAYGVKGLLVYSRAGIAPIAISDVARASETLWNSSGRYSWWDYNGSGDSDGNGLADRYIEPGETIGATDVVFSLTYRGTVSLATLNYAFGVHVVQPNTGNTFFTSAGGLAVSINVAAAPSCVRSGVGPTTFQYQVKNPGTRTLKNITVTDGFGTLTYAPQLAGGATATLTRTTTITTTATTFSNGIAVTALDAVTNVLVNASAACAGVVTHPGLSVVKTANTQAVLPGTVVTYRYVVANTGDVAINNIQVADDQLGAIGAPFNLAAGDTAPILLKTAALTRTTTNVASAVGSETCSGSTVTGLSSPVTVAVVHPGLTLVKTANHDCVVKGEPVTYTFTVTNTGDVAINNLLVTDNQLGVVGMLPDLAAQASTSFMQSTVLAQTTTNTAAVSGTDAAIGSQLVVPGNPVTVTVVNPSITVTETVSAAVVGYGQSVTFTYVVKNTGDVPLTNVSVLSHLNSGPATTVGTFALLSAGETQTVTRTINPVLAALTDKATVSGTGGCGEGRSVSDSDPTLNVLVIPAGWTGKVVCGACSTQVGCGIAGARVQVVRVSDGQLVGQPLTTGTDGSFTIDPDLAGGEYVLRVTAADYYPATTLSQTWATFGPDLTSSVPLFALPVTYRSVELAKGQIFFSDRLAWAVLQKGTIAGPVVPVGLDAPAAALGQLTDASFNSAGFTRSFRYFGYIPGYPELGRFDANRPVWLMMSSPLVSANGWDPSSANTVSFRNSVYVQDGTQFTGTPQANPSRNSQPYFIRILFSHPFDLTGSDGSARGSAYDYAVWLDLGGNAGITGVPLQTQIEPGVSSLLDGSAFPALGTVPWVVGAGPSSGAPGVVTAGWMVQATFQFKQAPGLALTPFFARGSFKNACGETPSTSPFAIHPEVEPSPDL